MIVTAFIGIGSNLGDRAENIRAAIAKIGELPGTRVIAVSSLLENAAVGGPENSPAFFNAAAQIETVISPTELLQSLLVIEQSLGRFRKQKWEPRPIDLDLLLYADQIIHDQDLTVPHPLMHQRRFVLQPLAEIAPETVHPVLNKSIAEILQDLK